ncbi:hypothetical protein [Maribacter sp. 2-571]|uniref:hypothetical protein n=1 Tax=Maribacter sp. 2-571 TaxID=3417569 RepID=UPI003D344B19
MNIDWGMNKNNIKRSVFLAIVSVLMVCRGTAQNMIPSSNWEEGTTEDLPNYNGIGNAGENMIEIGTNPFGLEALLWRVVPSSTNILRGMGSRQLSTEISNLRDYRFSVWVKVLNDDNARLISYLKGTTTDNSDFINSTGTKIGRDYYFRSGGNIPGNGNWILMVGFVKGIGSTKAYSEQGFYDLQGDKISDLGTSPFFFNTASPNFHVVCQLNNRGGTSENMLFFDPRFEEVDGSEPSISNLVDGNTTSQGGGPSVWSSNTNGVHFDAGNVGIGTTDPGADWKLAVNGKIRAKEIKVETGWADYVFEKDYPLPSLTEVEAHIAKKGHLINIPSAAEVETNGVELGEMNKLLLEKIEELTLYLIASEKKTLALQKANKSLKEEQERMNIELRLLAKQLISNKKDN